MRAPEHSISLSAHSAKQGASSVRSPLKKHILFSINVCSPYSDLSGLSLAPLRALSRTPPGPPWDPAGKYFLKTMQYPAQAPAQGEPFAEKEIQQRR